MSLPAFESLAFNAFSESFRTEDSNSTRFSLNEEGPDQEVVRIAQAVASTGNILSIPPPGLNTSWITDLIAPSLHCENMNSTSREALKLNIREIMNVTEEHLDWQCRERGNFCGDNNRIPLMFSYLAWLGDGLPFSVYQYSGNVTAAAWTSSHSVDWKSDFTLSVAVLPRVMDDWDIRWKTQNPWTNNSLLDEAFQGATLLKCKAKMSKYTLRFAYEGVAQRQSVEVLSDTEYRSNIDACTGYTHYLFLNSSDAGLGVEERFKSSCEYVDDENGEWTTPFARLALLHWSSFAAFTSFASLITGAQNALGGAPGSATMWGTDIDDTKTQVFSTVLSETMELARISGQSATLNVTHPNSSSTSAYDQALSLTRARLPTASRMNLLNALEDLFLNTTVSFASSEKLR